MISRLSIEEQGILIREINGAGLFLTLGIFLMIAQKSSYLPLRHHVVLRAYIMQAPDDNLSLLAVYVTHLTAKKLSVENTDFIAEKARLIAVIPPSDRAAALPCPDFANDRLQAQGRCMKGQAVLERENFLVPVALQFRGLIPEPESSDLSCDFHPRRSCWAVAQHRRADKSELSGSGMIVYKPGAAPKG